MASASFTFGNFVANFRQDHSRIHSKEFQTSIPAQYAKQEISRNDFLHINPTEMVNFQKSNLALTCNNLGRPATTFDRSVLVDIQGAHLESVILSYGIAKQCIRREKVLRFLASGSNGSTEGDIDFSLHSDLIGLQSLAVDMYPQQYSPVNDDFFHYDYDGRSVQSSYTYSEPESLSPRSPVNFGCGPSGDLTMTTHPDRQVSFVDSEAEIKALLATMANVYMSQSATLGAQRREMVVPYFTRSGARRRSKTQVKLQTAVATSSKSMKAGTIQKKKQKKKAGPGRETFKNNYSQVCESLLSVILLRNQDQTALRSLKKHGHEIPELLMQISAGLAGAGLAVIFSVVWKLGSGRVPLCTNKMLNAGFGIGMIWLSLSVNTLRDTVIEITKHANKLKLKESDMTNKIERGVKELMFRAAVVMATVVLRFA